MDTSSPPVSMNEERIEKYSHPGEISTACSHEKKPKPWRWRLTGIIFIIVVTPLAAFPFLRFLPYRWQYYIALPLSRIFHSPLSSLLPLTQCMALDFERLPEDRWLEHMSSIPSQLRFPVFNLSEPATREKLLEMMMSRIEPSMPEKRSTIASLKAKTIELYRLQDAPIVNNPEINRLFSEAGEDWLNSLTPEEKSLAMQVHRDWFVPELTIRNGNVVWVIPSRLKSVNEQFERYAGESPYFYGNIKNHTEQETILLLAFPWDMQASDFTAKYETDGLFVAPRRESCNCGTDMDCLPGTQCEMPFPGLSSDHRTACHLMGVLIPCRGRCVPGN